MHGDETVGRQMILYLANHLLVNYDDRKYLFARIDIVELLNQIT